MKIQVISGDYEGRISDVFGVYAPADGDVDMFLIWTGSDWHWVNTHFCVPADD